MLHEVYGVKGELGNLVIAPKLTAGQFDAQGKAKVSTLFAGRTVEVVFENPEGLEYGQYGIAEVKLNGKKLSLDVHSNRVVIRRARLAVLPEQVSISVLLASRHAAETSE
jgi:hypothetical protein